LAVSAGKFFGSIEVSVGGQEGVGMVVGMVVGNMGGMVVGKRVGKVGCKRVSRSFGSLVL